MSETSFIIYLDDVQQNRYRHWHKWENGQVIAFVLQYETWLDIVENWVTYRVVYLQEQEQ